MSTGNTSTRLTVSQLSDIMGQRCGAIEDALMALAQGLETFKTEASATFAAITEQMKARITGQAHTEVTDEQLVALTPVTSANNATPAPMVAAAIADGALSSVSDADLRRFYAACGQELRRRKLGPTTSAKAADREASKAEHKAKKSEYPSRPFGIWCVETKKELKRKFKDHTEAARQAAELTISMKREYRVIPLTH